MTRQAHLLMRPIASKITSSFEKKNLLKRNKQSFRALDHIESKGNIE